MGEGYVKVSAFGFLYVLFVEFRGLFFGVSSGWEGHVACASTASTISSIPTFV